MIINDYIIDDSYLIEDSEENETDSNEPTQELSSDEPSKASSDVASSQPSVS